jgi:hypothetical protein
MPPPLDFDSLKGIFHRQIVNLPEHRQEGPNTRYALSRCRPERLWHLFYPIAIVFGVPAPVVRRNYG